MRGVLLVSAVLFACVMAAPVYAQPTKPDPYQCAVAYSAASKERARAQSSGARGESLVHLMASTPQAHEFDRRTHALNGAIKALHPNRSAVMATAESGGEALRMLAEGDNVLLNLSFDRTDLFPHSLRIFGQVRACDQAYGFSPVVSPTPSPAAILAHYKARSDKAKQAGADRLAALDEKQCIARFLLAASVMPNDKPFQQVMAKKMETVGAKAMAADAGLTKVRLLELAQRAGIERGSKVKSPEDFKLVLEEVNACERRYGMPLTLTTPPK